MKSKHLLVLLLIITVFKNGFAQPEIRKQRTIGGRSTDFFSSMYPTNDGGLIAGGYSSSNISANKTDSSRGGDDYWIIKLDSSGNIQWDKTIGGNGGDQLTALQQTIDGGYILGGYSGSNISGDKTENRRGIYIDYWIVKLDSTGSIQWDKTIGGTDVDWLLALQQTGDGGYILGGYSYSDISGEKTGNSRGGYDYWVVKLDNNGNIQWDKTIGGSSLDYLFSLQQTIDGGYILGGQSVSDKSGEKSENSRGNDDYWVVKLDSFGNIQWDKTIGGNDVDRLTTLQQTIDEGYILGGYSGSNIFGDKTENNRGVTYTRDYWIVKLNRQGNIEWDKTIGGIENDFLQSLQQTTDGGYILGGASYSNISGEKTENNKSSFTSSSDYWVVKLDKFHNIQWDKTIGGNSSDWLYSIKEIKINRYVLGGASSSQISGDKIQNSKGGYDYWLVGLDYKKPFNKDGITANTLIVHRDNNLKVYPNPVKEVLYIQTNIKTIITLTDQSGKIIFTKSINGIEEINVSHLPAGLYYLKNNETGALQKVIVTK